MLNIFFGIFIILHGIVHLLYAGQSARLYEMQPGMTWPDASWSMSRFLGDEITRMLATGLLIVAGISFMSGGLGVLFKFAWWRPAIIGASIFSSILYLLLWDGGMKNLDNKGAFGVLINIAVLTVICYIKWPNIS